MGEEVHVRKAFLQAFQENSQTFEIPITCLSQSSLDIKLQLTKKSQTMILTLYTYQYILRINIISVDGFNKKEAMNLFHQFLAWVEVLAVKQGYEAVVIERGEKEFNKPNEYVTLSDLEVEIWNQYLQTTKLKQTDWVKIIQPKMLSAMLTLHTAMYRSFLEQETKDPTFEFKKYFNMYSFYLEGFTGSVIVEMLKNKNIRLVEKQTGQSVLFLVQELTEAKIESYLLKLFQQIRNKRRLLNLYDPPKYHFHRCVKEFLFSPLQEEEVYGWLTRFYTPDEIEQGLALQNKQNVKTYEMEKKTYGGYLVLARLLNLYVIVDVQDAVHIWKIEGYIEKEVCIKKWEELLVKELGQKLKKIENFLINKRNEG